MEKWEIDAFDPLEEGRKRRYFLCFSPQGVFPGLRRVPRSRGSHGAAGMGCGKQKCFNSLNTSEFCRGFHWRPPDLWKGALPLPYCCSWCVSSNTGSPVGMLLFPQPLHGGTVSPWIPCCSGAFGGNNSHSSASITGCLIVLTPI